MMRLEHLRIGGFGPYTDTQEVDFSALHAVGLFSVTGPTGAGKTTIFDALSYALYGSVPGARNEATGSIRSHHLAPGDRTEVTLEFTSNEGRWRVRRSPEYPRPKSRGTGTTVQRAAVELHRRTERGWEPVSGNKHEIDTRLAELVGLRRDQFERVVLLPQGEFRRLLHARSRERRELFRSLFGTEAIDRAVQELRDRARAAAEAAVAHGGAVAEQQTDAEGLLVAIETVLAEHADDSIRAIPASDDRPEPDRHEQLTTTLERLSAREAEVRFGVLPALETFEHRRRLDAAGATSARDRAVEQQTAILRRQGLDAEIAQLERALIPAERDAARAERARRAQPVVEIELRRKAAEDDLGTASAAASAAGAALDEAATEAGEVIDDPARMRDRIQRRLQELDDLAAVADRFAAERARQTDHRAQIERLTAEIEGAEDARRRADAERMAHTALVAEAAAADGSGAALASALLHAEQDLTVSKRRDAARERLAGARAALTGVEAELLECEGGIAALEQEQTSLAPSADAIGDRRTALTAARQRRNEVIERDELGALIDQRARALAEVGARVADLSRRFVAGMAPMLATELTEGRPCPVCGSCEHPAPARPDEEVAPVTESALRRATRDQLEATAELAGLRATVDELTVPDDLTVQWCDAAIAAAETELTQSESAVARIATVDRKLGTARQRLESLRTRRRTSATAVTIEAALVAEATEALGERADSDTAGLAEHHAELRAERDRIVALDERAREARTAIEMLSSEITDLDVRLTATREERAAAVAARDEIGRTLQQHADRLTPLGGRSPAEHTAALTRLIGALDAMTGAQARLADADADVGRLAGERDRLLARSGFPSIDEAVASGLPAEEVEGLEQTHVELTTRLTSARSALDQLDHLAIPAETPDLGALTEAAADANRAAQRATEERIRVADLCARGRSSMDKLRHDLRRLDELQADADRAHRVARLCEGKGAARIGLEAYILRSHLDQVVRFANLRLDSISAGRYRLAVADGALDGRSEWGLDLLVGDAHTGAQRDVRSLSGGETFYTSLALALGLSDVLSNRGSTAVNAVFIDEGFGSLDPEVIDLTIDVLHQLHGDGVTVGVITHVEGVREAVGAGLVVERRPGGDSRIIQQIA